MLTSTVAVVAAVLVVCAAAAVAIGAAFNNELAMAAFLYDKGLSAKDAKSFVGCLQTISADPFSVTDARALFNAATILHSMGNDPFSGVYGAYLNADAIGNPFKAIRYLSAAKDLYDIDYIRELLENTETESILSESQTMLLLKQLDPIPGAVAAGGSEAFNKAVGVLNRISVADNVIAEVPFRDIINLLQYAVSVTSGMDLGKAYIFDIIMYPGFTDEYAPGLRAAYEFLKGLDERGFSDIVFYMPDRAATAVKIAVELNATDIDAAATLIARVLTYMSKDMPVGENFPEEGEIVAFILRAATMDSDNLTEDDRAEVNDFLNRVGLFPVDE